MACTTVCKNIRKSNTYAIFKQYTYEDYRTTNQYEQRVEHITVFSDIESRVKTNAYDSAAEFVGDMRRLAGNSLRFCLEGDNLAYRKKARDLIKWVDDRMEQDLGVGAVPRVSADTSRCLDMLDYLLGGSTNVTAFWARIEVALGPGLWQEYQAQVAYPCDFGRLTSELLEDGIPPETFLGRAEVVCTNALQFWTPRGLQEVIDAAQHLLAKLTTRAQVDFPIAWRDRTITAPARVQPPPPRLSAPALTLPKPGSLPPPLGLGRHDSMPLEPPRLGGNPTTMSMSNSNNRQSIGGGAIKFKFGTLPGSAVSQADGSAAAAPLRAPSPSMARLPSLGGGGEGAAPALPRLSLGGLKLKVKPTGSSSVVGGGSRVGGEDGSVAGGSTEDMMDVSSSVDGHTTAPPALPTLGGLSRAPSSVVVDRKPDNKPPMGVFPSTADKPKPQQNKRPHPDSGKGGKDGEAGPAGKKAKPLSIAIKNDKPPPAAPRISLGPATGALPMPKPSGAQAPPPPGLTLKVNFSGLGSRQQSSSEPVAAKAEDSDDDVPLAEKIKPKQPPAPKQPTPGGAGKPSKPSHKPKQDNKRTRQRDRNKGKTAAAGGGQPLINTAPMIETAAAPSISVPAMMPTDGPAPAKIAPPKAREARAPTTFSDTWEEAAKVIVDKIWKHKWVVPPKRIDLTKYPPNHRYHTMPPPTTRYCFDEPVLERYPGIEAAYLAKVARPMDVATVRRNLENKQYADADEFLAELDLVFQNCLAFNAAQENLFEQEVFMAARHLRAYLDALAAEYLPPKPGQAYEEKMFNRSAERQLRLRQEREAALRPHVLRMVDPFKYLHSQMSAFVKSLKTERLIADTLLERVPEHFAIYYQTIERPMWLRAVMQSLDDRPKVGDVIDNLHLIAQNALAFNLPAADVDKASAKCVEAARLLERQLNERLPKVLLDMWEHDRRIPIQDKLNKLHALQEGGLKARPSSDSLEDLHDRIVNQGGLASKGVRGRAGGKQAGQADKGGVKPGAGKDGSGGAGGPMDPKQKENRKAHDKHTKEEVMEEVWAAMLRKKQQLGLPAPSAAPALDSPAKVKPAASSTPQPTPTKLLLRLPPRPEPSPSAPAVQKTPEQQQQASSSSPPQKPAEQEGVQPMDVATPEKEEGAAVAPQPSVVLSDFFPVLGGRKRPRPFEGGRKQQQQGRAVLEEILGGDVNTLLSRGARVDEEEEDAAMVKELKAQLAKARPAAAVASSAAKEEEEATVAAMEVDGGEKKGEEEEDRGEVQVLVRRIAAPRWQAGEWEGGMASLAFPSCPLVHVTLMARSPASSSSCPVYVNGERLGEQHGHGNGSSSCKRAKQLSGSGLLPVASSALALDLQGVPVAFRFAPPDQARAASLETLQVTD